MLTEGRMLGRDEGGVVVVIKGAISARIWERRVGLE
jgi:hypothetical protein